MQKTSGSTILEYPMAAALGGSCGLLHKASSAAAD
jgi:hypothetical protein